MAGTNQTSQTDATSHVRSGARHVLVVEDDSPIRAMLTDLLEDAGYGVLQASDGVEALEQLREREPDLIVLDLMLPGMSGWQFLERSRADLDRADVPVVILSAVTGRDYQGTLGVAAWLTKPFEIERLLRAVEDLAGPSEPPQPNRAGERSAADARVLLVEDEPTIREVIIERLSGEGFALETAETIAAARVRIAATAPALIVLDLMLPGRAGWDFLRERNGDAVLSRIPVLVLSAAPQDGMLQTKQLGANAYLTKPFDLDVLSVVVHSFVG